MQSLTAPLRFRLWDNTGTFLIFAGPLLVLAPSMLINAVNLAPLQKPGSPLHTPLLYLHTTPSLLWTMVGASIIVGFALIFYAIVRTSNRFGKWLEQHYPGVLRASDAGKLNQYQPVITPNGNYRARPVGFMRRDIEIIHETV